MCMIDGLSYKDDHRVHYLDTAIALSCSLCLNSTATGPVIDSRDVSSLKRRLWWSCYVLDRIMELNTGRHHHINPGDVQISPICLDDFEFCQFASTTEKNRSVVLGNVFIQIQLAYLFKWRLETCHHLGFGPPAKSILGLISLSRIADYMNEWRSSMSSQQKFNSRPSKGSRLLEDHYDCLRLLHSIAVLNTKKGETCASPLSLEMTLPTTAPRDLDMKRRILRHACEIVELVNLLKARGNAALLATSKETLQFSTFIILGQITTSSEPEPPQFPRDVRLIFRRGQDSLRRAWKEKRSEIEMTAPSRLDYHGSMTEENMTQPVECYEPSDTVHIVGLEESFLQPIDTCSSNAGYCGSCEGFSVPDNNLEEFDGDTFVDTFVPDPTHQGLTVHPSWLIADWINDEAMRNLESV